MTVLFQTPSVINRLQIEITTGCNLECVGCQRTIGLKEGSWVNKQMKLDQFLKLIENAPRANAIILQGIGEPTLHTELDEMVRAARDSKKFTGISFNTNALAREADYYAHLKTCGLSHVSISVDSLVPQTAAILREGTDCEALKSAIIKIGALFGGNITLSIVLSRRNLPELADLFRQLYGLGARNVEIQPLISYAGSSDPLCLDEKDREQARQIIQQTRLALPKLNIAVAAALTPNGTRCRRPFRALYVTVDGFLTPCCTTNDASLFGRTSLLDQPFAKAWAGAGVTRWLETYFDAEPEICHGCSFNPSGARAPEAKLEEGKKLLASGKLDEAEAIFTHVTGAPDNIEALHRQGLVRFQRGDLDNAMALLQSAYAISGKAQIGHNLAAVLVRKGLRAEAGALLETLIRQSPDYTQSYFKLATLRREEGKLQDAADSIGRLLERAIEVRAEPAITAALPVLNDIAADPGNLIKIANLLRLAGHQDEAGPMLARRIARQPADIAARLTLAMAQLAIVYRSEQEIAQRRTAYESELTALAQITATAKPEQLAAAADIIGVAKPFYLSYQGQDDRALQLLYGQIVGRIAQAAMPAKPLVPNQGKKIRVGFVTSFFTLHSVSKLFAGWLEQLNREKFEVYGYHIADTQDATSKRLAAGCDQWRAGNHTRAQWQAWLAADRPDALIYLELGMSTLPLQLASQRLAPVQCVTWGHPVTTGLPTMDYFLSSDLMEPPDGEDHYTEKLVRLPNLSIHYTPMPSQGGRLTRAAFGLRPGATVYVCCQSLYKYLPQYDQAFVRIAQAVPDSQFLFLGAPEAVTTKIFRERLAAAFRAAGLEPARHLVFSSPVPFDFFPSFLQLGDVYLDSIGWSGGNTTLEAIACGLPVLTMPTGLMRGRHTYAFLRHMGLDELIAPDLEGFVAAAKRLSDPAAREKIRARMTASRDRLYADTASIRALEKFLVQVVKAAR